MDTIKLSFAGVSDRVFFSIEKQVKNEIYLKIWDKVSYPVSIEIYLGIIINIRQELYNLYETNEL